MKGRSAFAIALLLIAGWSHAQTRDERGAAAVVAAFYRMHLPEAHSGLMTRAELRRRRSFLSERLYRLYADAIRTQQEFIANHPSKPSASGGPPSIYKPPCVESGGAFDGLDEGPAVQSPVDDPPQQFQVAGTETLRRNRMWRVAVRFWYDTNPPSRVDGHDPRRQARGGVRHR